MQKPELLAPAKNLERLKVAVTYGADAVYVGGQNYGLRARADNFTDAELVQAVAFAHRHGAKVYITLNAFLHDADFEGLMDYCQWLEAIGVDAAIVSDLGVIRTIRANSNLDIHLSTQASCLNTYAAQVWQSLGVKRAIVGRELSVAEAGSIRERVGIEVEMFAHGAMCMAYSGHCTISNFTAGRDSNRGGCIQSCRLPYRIEGNGEQGTGNGVEGRGQGAEGRGGREGEEQNDRVTFMSSKDLWGIRQIGEFFRHRICSVKIEGRMKSSFYVAMTCRAYRRLIDDYAAGCLTDDRMNEIAAELESVPHRDYCSGSLDAAAGSDSIFGQLSGINTGTYQALGMVMEKTPEKIVVRLLEPLNLGDEVEVVPVEGEPIRWKIHQFFSVTGEGLRQMRKDGIVCIPREDAIANWSAIAKLNVVRRKAIDSQPQAAAIASP